MILYALRCDCGHEFDQWFENMADYDTRRAELACPSCGGHTVSKAIMAPRVGKAPAAAAMPAHPCNPQGCANSMCPMAQMM